MRTRVVVGAAVVALACLLASAVLWAEPVEFGWFAYAGPEDVLSPGFTVVTPRRGVGLALTGLALVLLGAAGGVLLGRRRG